MSVFAAASHAVALAEPLAVRGRVAALRGLTILVEDLPVPVGSLVSVQGPGSPLAGGHSLRGEVVGFTAEHAVVMLLGQTQGVRPGDAVLCEETAQTARVGSRLLGRCIDGLGRPIDGLGPLSGLSRRPLNPEPLSPMRRARITRMLQTGVRAVDLMTTMGCGQRLGLFAGPGVGKSSLLASIAKGTSADVSVIALIGERGREVRDFIEHTLGPAGLARSVVVVATGDESPLMRIRAAKVACAAAEQFREQGLDVLLMMDSITRFAHAQRQIGLSVGEPPATRGYTPSVFAQLALLLERAGSLEASAGRAGSITGIYTILVEGDDMTEPVSDAARGILDGHVMLSRKLAQRGHFPAVDVLDSVSRVADDVVTPEHAAARRQVGRMLALYRDVEDLVQIGAYARGATPETDVAIDAHRAITDLLRQGRDEPSPFDDARTRLLGIAAQTRDQTARLLKPRTK
jgi:flagellum-specific ATP synthase